MTCMHQAWLAIATLALLAMPARAQMAITGASAQDTSMESMGAMGAHMHFTDLQAEKPGDRDRAAAILAEVRRVVAPYADVHRAEADGWTPNLPGFVRRHYHFSRAANFRAALIGFDPSSPTSLLYDRDSDGTFHLTGVMYTAPRGASLAELDRRVPLSIARWHQHLNLCIAPQRTAASYTGPAPRFGNNGSIATADECSANGGRFVPQLLGWMVHIYPFETDPAKVWAIDRDMH